MNHPHYDKDLGALIMALPCGATAYGENGGESWRCMDCMAVWGSIACGCSNDLRKLDKESKEESNRKS